MTESRNETKNLFITMIPMVVVLLGIPLALVLIAGLRSKYLAPPANTARTVCSAHHLTNQLNIFEFMKENPADRFPATIDATAASNMMDAKLGIPSRPPGLSTSRGLLYVGSGLTVEIARAENALLFFCRYSEIDSLHTHGIGYTADDNGDDETLVDLLEQAIQKGESGDIPYTAEAIETMKEQLKFRKSPPHNSPKPRRVPKEPLYGLLVQASLLMSHHTEKKLLCL